MVASGGEVTAVNMVDISIDSIEYDLDFESSQPRFSCIQDWTGGGEGNITADPRFADLTIGNFHLGATSPCIDAGTPVMGLMVDIDGNSRPLGFGFDIGADEFVPVPLAARRWTWYR